MSNCHTVFHMCWLSLGYLKFLSAPWHFSLLSILFPMPDIISYKRFLLLCILLTICFGNARKRNRTKYKTVTSCSIERQTLEYLCNAMQWQKKRREREEKMYLNCIYVHIRIYIFHEFVLEHALGNRINVYCPSQSCRHQTIKWRNSAKTENKVPNSVWTVEKERENEKKNYRIINETYHVDP